MVPGSAQMIDRLIERFVGVLDKFLDAFVEFMDWLIDKLTWRDKE